MSKRFSRTSRHSAHSDQASDGDHVVGTVQLWDDDQRLRLVPVPSRDPNDPLNLPKWRKVVVLSALIFYGITGLSAVATVGAIMPFLNMLYANPIEVIEFMGGAAPPEGIDLSAGPPAGIDLSAGIPAGIPAGLPAGIDLSAGPPAGIDLSAGPPPGFSMPSSSASGKRDLYKRIDMSGMPALPPGVTMGGPMPPNGYVSASRISLLGSLPSLFMGLSNYISVPISLAVGRRAILIVMLIVATGGAIYAAFASRTNATFEHHLAARCIIGLGAGSFESLSPLIIYDVFFVHQRGAAIGAMWSFSAVAGYFLGMICSEVVSKIGIPWLYGIFAILCGFSTIIAIFFIPETRYNRSMASLHGEMVTTDAYGNITVVDEKELPTVRTASANSDDDATVRYEPRTFRKDMRLFVGSADWSAAWQCYVDMAKGVILPNIMWIVILNSIAIAVSISSVLTFAEPLITWQKGGNWPMNKLGLATVALIPACFLSFIVSGWGMDAITKHMSKRNHGVHEPENRLPSLVLPVVSMFIGALIFGFANSDTAKYHWMVSMAGTSFLNFGFLCLNTTLSVYAVESYPKWAGPLLISVCALRNMVSFALNFFIVDFIAAKGYDGAFGIYAAILLGTALFGIPIFVWGKQLRRWSAKVVNVDT